MAAVAAQRYFDFGFANSDNMLFVTGRQWVGFARLVGHIETVLENELGPRSSWPDLAKGFHRELWRGEHDLQLGELAWALPSHKDFRMHACLKHDFQPLTALLHSTALWPLAQVAAVAAGSSEIPGCQLGDVTAAVGGRLMSPSEKLVLVEKLNCVAQHEHDVQLMFELTRFAANIFRNKCTVFSSLEAAKLYMVAGGLHARTVLVDGTMPTCRQTSHSSRTVCLPPTRELQRNWAAAINDIPVTPFIGHVLARHTPNSLEELNRKLATTVAHKLQITVPIAVPEKFMRYRRSAQKRAQGPVDDHASWIDFTMLTICRRSTTTPELDENMWENDADGKPTNDLDPKSMPMAQLHKLYGPAASEIAEVFFQCSSHIATTARFLPKDEALMARHRDIMVRHRKGQVDPSVFVSALQSALLSTSEPLRHNEVLVLLTGGTPEAAVAGILCGYSEIIYIGDSQEVEKMTLPDCDDEPVNFMECAIVHLSTHMLLLLGRAIVPTQTLPSAHTQKRHTHTQRVQVRIVGHKPAEPGD